MSLAARHLGLGGVVARGERRAPGEAATLAKLRDHVHADLAAARKAHRETIERERAEHVAQLAAEREATATAKQQAADLLARAQADAAEAARTKEAIAERSRQRFADWAREDEGRTA